MKRNTIKSPHPSLDLTFRSADFAVMNATVSVTADRAKLPAVVRFARFGRVVGITVRKKTVANVVSPERMESMLETIELIANPSFMRSWKKAKAGKGKYHPASALAD
jgi:antitoxin (DNA-binding transcriptional repressor) of toxin-antitoxin stability system